MSSSISAASRVFVGSTENSNRAIDAIQRRTGYNSRWARAKVCPFPFFRTSIYAQCDEFQVPRIIESGTGQGEWEAQERNLSLQKEAMGKRSISLFNICTFMVFCAFELSLNCCWLQCWQCEAEAIYHCCWNTAYCSVECQQVSTIGIHFFLRLECWLFFGSKVLRCSC